MHLWKTLRTAVGVALLGFFPVSGRVLAADVAPLPDGVRAVWDVDKAVHETTPTRERICLNGLWRWQPADATKEAVPAGSWGHFKVPGSWPGITDYMQKDSQTVFTHPDWAGRKLGDLNAAWYQREFTVPRDWSGRQIGVRIDYLNSYAAVFVDGKKAGEIRFPAGELDLTSVCPPGSAHQLGILVVALPLKGVLLSYTDSASAREVKGSVPRRGLCGDVYLVGQPSGARISGVNADTSARKQEVTFGATLEHLVADQPYVLRARIRKDDGTIREFISPAFRSGDLREGRAEFTEKWMPKQLWDLNTPKNTVGLELALLDAAGTALDVQWGTRLGFREFWIEGRDFVLNGTRVHLSAVPLDNAQVGAALSTYVAARESLERLQGIGINCVYTHNYGCEPGSHLGFGEILRAADDVGMLVALTQPHFSHYEWKSPDADLTNGYARDAAFYVRVARDHPSVVMYSMSHNATGYDEDMNPDLIDGLNDPRDSWSARNAKTALRAEAIVQRLDPSRLVYHHASGNLGTMHVINFYPNFVPIQELSDWFGHWATAGVKPVFLCEYGAPFTWDWTMYRGWYQGQREFGSAQVPWEFCLAEWNAQFFGDRAYAISGPEKANLRWEAQQFRAGKTWHRWDYPNEVGSPRFDERYPLFARYLTDNWRAFRTWGVSGTSPWEYGHFWKLREGVDRGRVESKTDWDSLQRPGFSPDYEDHRCERMDLAYGRADWIATPAADALLRNNRPLLAYIAGKQDGFTGKEHNFLPGGRVGKQLILINDSRVRTACECRWTLSLPNAANGSRRITVDPGRQERLEIGFDLPASLAPGSYELSATFLFDTGETQTDRFSIDVLPRPRLAPVEPSIRIALFDPVGETRALLERSGIRGQTVEASTDLAAYDLLIVGKAALSATNAAPDIGRVREGLKVLLFEQTSEALEKRFGFHVEEYGLRQVFPRVPDHPLLAGLTEGLLRDWSGAATLLPAQLAHTLRPRYGSTVSWCGMPVTRLWRCGNRGNVASVLIEKPERGDFLSLLDGGFGLQYSTLLEYHEGSGMVLFCQADVTGRTEADPAAERLVQNILGHMGTWKPGPRRRAVYVGEPAGKNHLEAAGVNVQSSAGDGLSLSSDQVLIVGPGGGKALAAQASQIAGWLKSGGHLLAIGLDEPDAAAVLPHQVGMKAAEHIAAWFEPPGMGTLLAGISPADVHNRDPRVLPLITTGAQVLGDGIVARMTDANVVLCQFVPWRFEGDQSNLRRTRRHASVLLSRLLGNMGVASSTPLLDRFHQPVTSATAPPEQRWTAGFYGDPPQEWDDPYRFFRW